MKNPFKKKALNPQAPRSMDDINKEYRELLVAVANAQYMAFIKNLEVENLNKRLIQVNQEAAQRQELDRQVAAEEAKKEEKNEKQS